MSDERIESHEERLIILRDKAAREGFIIGDDVLDYIAEKYGLPTTLKGALINVQAFASRRGAPVTMSIARLVIDGIRETAAPPAAPAADTGASVASAGALGVSTGDSGEHAARRADSTGTPVSAAASQNDTLTPAMPNSVDTAIPTAAAQSGTPQPPTGDSVIPSSADQQAEAITESQPGPDELITDTLFVPPAPSAPSTQAQAGAPSASAAPTAGGQMPSELAAAEPRCEPVTVPAASPEPATVWFAPMRSVKKESLVKRAGVLLERAGLADAIEDGDLVAIKLHFGEEGNTGFVQPVFLREVVRRVKEHGGRPFLTDSNTLYRGKRSNAVDHIGCAIHNGFSFATVEAPVVIADGLDGREAVDVPIDGFLHFESVRIGSAAAHADAIVVVTHVKGHEATGFGGAMKNVGMGFGSRSAKQRMHADFTPAVTAEKCIACNRCVTWCPVRAIVIGPDRVAEVDYEICYGCGECVAACPHGAIATQWKTTPDAIQEKIVEHCAGVLSGKDGKVVYLSFVTNVSPDCDCWHFSDAGIVADIGVLASTDLVAIDQAAYDLVTAAVGLTGTKGEGLAAGDDKFQQITGIDGSIAMRYAEDTGLGTREYALRTLE